MAISIVKHCVFGWGGGRQALADGGAAERAAGRRGAATENPNADCFKTIRRHAVAADAARTHTIATKKLSGLLRAKERAKDMVKEPQRVGSSN